MNARTPHAPREERGQILVIFALSITAVMAMVGLVLDGSGAFAQRRTEQNVADIASLAGANAYLNTLTGVGTPSEANNRKAAALAAAVASATGNGYTNGVRGAVVNVSATYNSSGASVAVGLTGPHSNNFARIVGQASWDVSVTATAMTGVIDTGIGSAPWTMHIDAFNADGSPKYTEDNPQNFGTDCGDYPTNSLDMSWTDFNGADNTNSSEVKGILNGDNVVTATFSFGQYLGQHNEGCHTTLWDYTQNYLAGKDVPIPIVGPPTAPATTCFGSTYTNGCFKGWVMFHVIGAFNGTDKYITGYFLEDFRTMPLTVGECTPTQEAAGTCGTIITNSPFENTDVRLTD